MNILNSEIPKLSKNMRCGIFVNDNGKIVIIHDKPLEKELSWIEYDDALTQTHLVYEDGSVQELGVKIPESMIKKMRNGQEVILIYLVKGKTKSAQQTVFLWRSN